MSTDTFASRPATIVTASDALVQAMLRVAPAGDVKSAARSTRAAALNLASDALLQASRLITRFSSGAFASNRAKEIAKVRAMAGNMRYTDHRMASDLLAAADRHEREIDSQSETLR